MKTINKKLITILAFTGLLAGCSGGGKSSNTNSVDDSGNYDSNSQVSDNTSNGGESTTSVGGNSSSEISKKSDWTAAEKKILNDYFYGVDVPFMYVEDAEDMVYDADYASASVMAPTCSKTILDNYAKLFDKSWDVYSDLTDEEYIEYYGYTYSFQKQVEVNGQLRFVSVDIYGSEYDPDYEEFTPTADGTGYFTLDIYDPYFYEFPTEVVDAVLEYYESTAVVPAYEGADFYSASLDYIFFGAAFIYCYTNDKNSVVDYSRILVAANYKDEGIDADTGYYMFLAPTNDLEIGVGYDADYGDLDIALYYYEESVPTSIDMVETLNVKVGESKALNATVLDQYDEQIDAEIVFSMKDDSNPDVTVSEEGLVSVGAQAVVGSTATVVATCGEGEDAIVAECVVTVKEASSENQIVDVLTQKAFGLTDGNSSYVSVSYTSENGTKYDAFAAASHGIQLRSKNNTSGIVNTTSVGNCVSIEFEFDASTTSTKDLDIYASNEPFAIGDMYSTGKCVKVGSVTTSNTTFEFDTDYAYIGIRSSDGAFYLTSITITWAA